MRLAQASERDRQLYRIAPSGYGIHWMALDEDLSIQGLLTIAIAQSQASESAQLLRSPRLANAQSRLSTG